MCVYVSSMCVFVCVFVCVCVCVCGCVGVCMCTKKLIIIMIMMSSTLACYSCDCVERTI